MVGGNDSHVGFALRGCHLDVFPPLIRATKDPSQLACLRGPRANRTTLNAANPYGSNWKAGLATQWCNGIASNFSSLGEHFELAAMGAKQERAKITDLSCVSNSDRCLQLVHYENVRCKGVGGCVNGSGIWMSQVLSTPPPSVSTDGNPCGVLDRVLQLLSALADAEEPLTLSELSRRTGLAKSTTFRLLGTLRRHRLIIRTESRYQIACGLSGLGFPIPGAASISAPPPIPAAPDRPPHSNRPHSRTRRPSWR